MKIKEYHWLFPLLAIISIVLIFRVLSWNIADLNLSFDEAQYWTWSLNIDWGYYSKPPLLAWLIGLSTKTCGISELCLRMSSPILYSLSTIFISLTAFLMCEKDNKNRAALIAGTIWILTVSYTHLRDHET